MRYISILEGQLPTEPPPPALMEGIGQLGEEATRAGVLLDTAGLLPSAAGARITLRAGDMGIVDGPFTESKELISYSLWEVASKEEAVEWTRRFMDLHRERWPGFEAEAKVLKIMGPEDFGPTQA